ncbi:polyprenyl synthetase family protein [Schaalia suimastitidis]|uniref:polyprenyl synthetase family protein n=1 Tax=Schaalia suimastitidis TaxID=121163 RepID=UPI0003F7AF03|nr:polyprenyl synthetase family protein [Schaalia suimastitidis]
MPSLTDSLPQLRSHVDDATLSLCDELLSQLASTLASQELHEAALRQVTGGKRFRGIFALLGAELVSPEKDAPLALAAALEFYQASALAHDDLIDHASTRRGQPTPHVAFTALHRERHWSNNPQNFGTASAILLGDLLLSLAEMALGQQCRTLASQDVHRLRHRFSAMHAQVTIGQYMDIRAEHLPLDDKDATCVNFDDAIAVVERKAAHYSVVQPFLLGATYAAAPSSTVDALEKVLLPWGIAFQLRDDDLGVFGQSTTTGKPAGDDLREGKRTALLAITWRNATTAERAVLRSVLGHAKADPADIARATRIVAERGKSEHEALITQLVERGFEHLAEIDSLPTETLAEVAQIVTHRSA